MKKVLLCAAVAALALVGCKTAKPEATIANLKAAIEGESNASAKYAAFSAKAAEQGFVNIAKLFAATSKAEAIHVSNHQAVLGEFGEVYEFTAEVPVVDTTLANLNVANSGEVYEFETMYPEFLEQAAIDKVAGATKSFTWAMDAEKGHSKHYLTVIASLTEAGNDASVSAVWYVCPKCGNLYSSIEALEACELCASAPASFIVF